MTTDDDTRRAIAAVFRIESVKLIAGLARMVRDVGLAEELAQDALVAALEHWPAEGVPEKPGAWLMATAKRRAIDRLRHARLSERKHDELAHALADRDSPVEAIDEAIDDHVGDDLLRLLFVACHPLLSSEARVALTLRLLGGLTTVEIARAFLVPEATIAQRVVRAKKTLAEAGVAFEVPRGAELGARLSSVLEVVYLIFNEGYSATAGDDWMRPALCEDALRLGRILAGLAPDEPEVHGLVALMELQASRSRARVGPTGEPVLLLEQNRGRRGAGRGGWCVRGAGGAGGVSRASEDGRGDRLGAHRGAVRATRTDAGGGAQPRGGGGDGVRTRGGFGGGRWVGEGGVAAGVPPVAERAG